MARKPKAVRPEAEKTQVEQFIETARQIGADETGEAFERAFDKIVPPRRPSLTDDGGGGHRSRKHRKPKGAG